MLGDRFDDVLERAQEGDALAFAQLWRDTQPMLLRSLWVLDGERCEEISSHAWSRVIMGLGGFSGGEVCFRRFLASVAHQQRSTPVDRLDGSSLDPGTVAAGTGEWAPTPAYLAVEEGRTRTALSLIARLPAEQSEPVVLHVAMGLDVADIAEVTGRTPGVVRGAVHWGLRRLEYMIAADLETPSSEGQAFAPSAAPSPEAGLDGPEFSDNFGVADMFLAGRTDVLSSDVEALLAAAAAPASGPELAGARDAVATFLALGPGAAPAVDPFATGPRVLRRVKHRLATAAFASGLFVTGLSAAAHARVLPDAIQNVADSVMEEVPKAQEAAEPRASSTPATKKVGAPAQAAAPRASAPGPGSSQETAAAAAYGQCNAYAKGGQAVASKAYTDLVRAAGGETRIPEYCGGVPHPKATSAAGARPGGAARPEKRADKKADPKADRTPASNGARLTSNGQRTPGASRPPVPPKK